MIRKIHHLSILSLLFLATLVSAQRNCASHSHLEDMMQQNPEMRLNIEQIERHTQDYVNSNKGNQRAVITIPVVFHIVWRTGKTVENISDAQIQSQLDVMNKDFRKLNTDVSKTPSLFSGLAADCEIQFCMAQRDPTGASTNGIVRYQSTRTTDFGTNDAMKSSSTGGANAWNSSKYLNIWVCSIGGGILGYAQFPGGTASTDGVVIDYRYFGTTGTATSPFNLGRTATHEVGHWLNLRHIWGDANCGSDLVTDTPTHTTSNGGCPSFPKNNTCGGTTNTEMTMNYMDYTDDACMYMFSAGQKARMQALFATGGARASLLTSDGCNPGTTPICSAPTGLASSSITSSGATVSWAAATGATSYNLQYKTSSATTWTTVSNITTTSRALTGLSASTTYNYQVATVCSSGTSAYSTASSFTTTAATTCAAPTGLASSSITSSGATVSWAAATGATSYNLQYKTSSATTWTTVSNITTTSRALTGLSASTTYNYQVATVCSSGTSAYSTASSFTTTAATTCAAPTGLASSSITTTGATVSWAAATGATSYNLQYKKSSSSTWTTVSNITTTSRALTGLSSSTTYNYQVATVCSSGTSAYSTASSFTTSAATTCAAPTGLASSSITTTGATVSWAAVSGATSYKLQYKKSSSSTWTTVSNITTTSRALTGLSASTTYNYQVSTVCSSGSSAYSTASSFTTSAVSGCTDSFEPNNSQSAAVSIALNSTINALINSTSDQDWYKITTTSTAPKVKVTLSSLPADYDLYLYNSAGTLLASSLKNGTTTETVKYNTATVGATYYVRVYSSLAKFNTTACYALLPQSSASNFREINDDNDEVLINDAAQLDFTVAPNPASDEIILSFLSKKSSRIDVTVLDITGKVAMQKTIDTEVDGEKMLLDVSNLLNGIYFINVKDDATSKVTKLLIQR